MGRKGTYEVVRRRFDLSDRENAEHDIINGFLLLYIYVVVKLCFLAGWLSVTLFQLGSSARLTRACRRW